LGATDSSFGIWNFKNLGILSLWVKKQIQSVTGSASFVVGTATGTAAKKIMPLS
jgi:hypothetical protein